MDDKSPPSTNAPPPAERTSEPLRELQERARAALKAQRERMGRLEAQLTEQLDSIAHTLAEQASSQTDGAQQAEQSLAEAERLRQELTAAQQAWQAERDRVAAEHASRQQKLGQRQAELDARAERLDADRGEVDARWRAVDERAAELDARERGIGHRQQELTDREHQFSAGQQELADATRQFDEQRAAWDGERATFDEAKSTLEKNRDELAGKVAQLTAEAAKLREASAQHRADAERQRNEQQAAWDDARTALENERLAVEKERDELADAVATARAELAAARNEAETAGDLEELQQKFDLALEDVQRLRRRVAELEQELSARPAVDQTESVELVHLRSERDALAERVAELEQQPAAPADGDAAQEMADLQRRFELAVEDVRDLKKANSQLEAKLAEAQTAVAASASTPAGGSSWEALKQQMLADLEGDGDDGDEERRAERTTIEDTIRITDDVVANKDREIAQLKAQLAEGGGGEPAEDAAIRELIDTDTVIQQHREKIAMLESEMQDKLRATELELSVERAKIAREQAHLAELRADIESIRPGRDTDSANAGQAPKRRWLSKLGLSGEDEGK